MQGRCPRGSPSPEQMTCLLRSNRNKIGLLGYSQAPECALGWVAKSRQPVLSDSEHRNA
jgi:hypothetical protein